MLKPANYLLPITLTLPVSQTPRMLIIIMVVNLAILLIASITRHTLFYSTGFDLGIYDQVTYLISQNLTPISSILGFHHLGNHAAWAVYPLAVLYKIFPSVYWLLIVQAIFLTGGAWPVWALAKIHGLSEKLALSMAVVYLLYPVIFNVNLFDFHPEVMSIPVLILAIAFAIINHLVGMTLALIWVLGGKAVLSLTVMAMGWWLLILEKKRVLGAIAIGLGFAWFLITTQLIIPTFSGTEAAGVWRYTYLGNSVLEIILNLFLKPHLILGKILSYDTFKYLLQLALPIIWVFFLKGKTGYSYVFPLLATLPALTLNILAEFPFQRSLAYQYSLPIMPFLLLAVIRKLAASYYSSNQDQTASLDDPPHPLNKGEFEEKSPLLSKGGKVITQIIKYPARAIIVWSLIIFPWLAEEHNFFVYLQNMDSWQATQTAISLIPPQGAVLTDNYLCPHLSHRSQIKLLSQIRAPVNLTEFDYVILNLRHPWPDTKAMGAHIAETLKNNPQFSVSYQQDEVFVFAKKNITSSQMTR